MSIIFYLCLPSITQSEPIHCWLVGRIIRIIPYIMEKHVWNQKTRLRHPSKLFTLLMHRLCGVVLRLRKRQGSFGCQSQSRPSRCLLTDSSPKVPPQWNLWSLEIDVTPNEHRLPQTRHVFGWVCVTKKRYPPSVLGFLRAASSCALQKPKSGRNQAAVLLFIFYTLLTTGEANRYLHLFTVMIYLKITRIPWYLWDTSEESTPALKYLWKTEARKW